MAQNTTDDAKEVEATISVDSVIKALKLNDTHGVDDRVIAVPQKDRSEASVRRAFTGSERYSNPKSAPVHIKPESLVEDAWRPVPCRADVDAGVVGVPENPEDRTDEDEEAFDEALEQLQDVWEQDIRSMILGKHSFEAKGCDITLVCTEDNNE